MPKSKLTGPDYILALTTMGMKFIPLHNLYQICLNIGHKPKLNERGKLKMDKYLIHYKGKGRIIELNTRETTADKFGDIKQSFAHEVGVKSKSVYDSYAEIIRLYPDQIKNGVFYSWGLASADGAWFNLVALPDTTKEQLDKTRKELLDEQDVVSLSITRIQALI